MTDLKLSESELDTLRRRLEGDVFFDSSDRLHLHSIMIKIRTIDKGDRLLTTETKREIDLLIQENDRLRGALEDIEELGRL